MFLDKWEWSKGTNGAFSKIITPKKALSSIFFFHLFPLTHKIISETICTGSKITCCLALSFFHPNLSLCLSSKLQQNHTGSEHQEEKTEHSNLRGLWTSQMHSERPLIKIISAGDGRKGRDEKKQNKKKNGGQLGWCKISFLLFNLSETEAGNPLIILLKRRAPTTGISIQEGRTHVHTNTHGNTHRSPSSAKEGRRGH